MNPLTRIDIRAVTAVTVFILAVTAIALFSSVASASARYVEQIAPPPEELKAIRLSGKSENPNPESWLRIVKEPDGAHWWVGPTGRLVVRNVSQAAMIPFLPDPAKATGAAMILAPGGGTLVLGMESQGYQIAKWLNERGIAAFVLKYRLLATPKELDSFLKFMETRDSKYSAMVSAEQGAEEEIATREDGLEAVRYIRAHASQWKISPDRIGFMGFSAGGYTAISMVFRADDLSRPNLLVLIYGGKPGITKAPSSAPPIFIAATSDDPLYSLGAGVDCYLNLYAAWQQARVPAELHMFGTGGHGFGVAPRGKSSDQWLDLLGHWLQEQHFETR